MDIINLINLHKIEEYINIILKEYEKYKYLQQKNEKLLFYPENYHNEVNEIIKNIKELIRINSTNSSILKEYNKLLTNLGYYIGEIKKTSFGNDIFSEIINNILNLNNFRIRTCAIISGIHDIKIESDNENLVDEYPNQNMNENSLNLYNILNEQHEENNNDPLKDKIGDNMSGIINDEEGNVFYDQKFENKNKKKTEEQLEKIYKNFIGYKKYYANLLVKEEYFNQQKLKDILKFIPKECEKFLLDFRKIRDELIIKQFKIREEFLDCKYNFIIPNMNFVPLKGGEIYNPPDGWFGYGLNVKNIYKNNKNFIYKEQENIQKAIAYYSFNDMNPRKIKKELFNIISNAFPEDNKYAKKARCMDKRTNMKVGAGIFLSPKIDFIESNTGMIYFDGKAYKIALMVSVIANKIRQPDSNFWVLRNEEIELNKIIFKEIHFEENNKLINKN